MVVAVVVVVVVAGTHRRWAAWVASHNQIPEVGFVGDNCHIHSHKRAADWGPVVAFRLWGHYMVVVQRCRVGNNLNWWNGDQDNCPAAVEKELHRSSGDMMASYPLLSLAGAAALNDIPLQVWYWTSYCHCWHHCLVGRSVDNPQGASVVEKARYLQRMERWSMGADRREEGSSHLYHRSS